MKVLFRSWTAAGALLVRRRARQDGLLLMSWTLTVAFAALLAIAGPAHLAATIDAGAREAVESAGSATDLIVEATVDATNQQLQLPALNPPDVENEARTLAEQLPEALGQTVLMSTVAVTGPVLLVSSPDVQVALADPGTQLRLAPTMLTSQNLDALAVVTGALPGDSPRAEGSPLPVVISTESAQASSLGIGSVITLPVTDVDIRERTALRAEVVGIVREVSVGPEELSPWRDVTAVWNPTELSDGGSTFVSVALLMSPASADRLIRSQGSSFTAVLRYSFDPSAFTNNLLVEAAAESTRLVANTGSLITIKGGPVVTSFGLGDAVVDFPNRARATLAEISIIAAGVVGAASAVLVLGSRLIVARRLPGLMLERARGSSLIAIGLRNVVEAAVIVIVAVVIASVVATAARLDGLADPLPLVLVVSVGMCAGVIQIMVALRARSRATRVGVNRRDVLVRRRQSRVARLSGELAVLLLAAISVLSLLERGLLQTASEQIDPLIACAPLLFAAAVTVLTLRGSQLLARVAVAAAKLSRGIAGPVMASRLPRGIAVVPLTALTIAICLVVSTGVLASTVRSGQVDASWQVVGADLRIEGGITAEDVAVVAAADGVTVASGFTTVPAQLNVGANGTSVTLLAIDRDYPDFLARLPEIAEEGNGASLAAFTSLSRDVPDDAPLPVIVGEELADRSGSGQVTVAIEAEEVALQIVGSVRSGTGESADEPLIYLDLASLARRVSSPLAVDSVVALGTGADAAVDRLDLRDAEVVTRTDWLEDRRQQALIAGVEQAMLAGVAVLALLALIAIVCTALAGSTERARYLALLRTLGVRRRFGLFLAMIDQVPLLLASLFGGTLAGVGIAILLLPALGLEFLTGGLTSPALSIPPFLLVQATGGVVLVFAIGTLSEVLLRRRDRVSDTVRVGETI